MTAGMDKVVKIFDLRRPDATKPLFEFSGHVDDSINKVVSDCTHTVYVLII